MEKRIYFKNLGALRFFAALAVIFHHVEQYKYWAKIPSIWGSTTIDALGHKAVSFFFVLSGFLITFLLLEENRKTSEINIRNFYIRRILRIWPVYYLVVIICLFVVPFVFDLTFIGLDMHDEKFHWRVILLLAVLPNVLRIFAPGLAGGNQLWSIGVEEQFYIVWPLLIRIFIKRVVLFLAVFIVLKFLGTVLLGLLLSQKGGLLFSALYRFWILLKVEQMAIGALGAWVLFHDKKIILRVIYAKGAWYLSLLCLFLLLMIPVHHWLISFVESFIFLVIILNISTNNSIRISLEHPILIKLGNMSYGIYMYHTLCITVCLYALTGMGLHQGNDIAFNFFLYAGSVALTLGVAYISYEWFEKYFLGLKERFMIVKSGRHKDSPAS